MIKVVIFDLDDTLINEIDFVKSGYKVVAKEIATNNNLNVDKVYNILIEEFNINRKNVFNRTLDNLNIEYNKEDILKLVKLYKYHMPDIKLDKDVIELLYKIKKQGLNIGIITDGDFITQSNKVKSLNLYDYVDKIICTDELGKEYWKPNPKAFNLMKEKFNCKYEEMTYIGDNPNKDFYIKKSLNILTVRFLNKDGIYFDNEYFEDIKEDVSIKKLNEILKIII